MKRSATYNKLWSVGRNHDRLIEAFTIGADRDLDLLLAPFDILGSIAHCDMLKSVSILSEAEWRRLRHELARLYDQAVAGELEIEEQVEDIHSQVELMLTETLGEEAKRIHTGRSRNDQVLLDIRLFSRDRIHSVVQAISELFNTLIQLSERHKDVLMPGYTHLQVAMPSSFGLWFAAFAESLLDDLLQLQAAWKIVNKNPLGSAAGYGSSFPLDRQYTTRLLGFDDLNYNALYAQMGRGRTERIVTEALASVAETLSRLAMDLVLFLSQNFDFISFPEAITTGSSIMPHKKNPDVFELIRARCNRLRTVPQQIVLLMSNLPSGYHRDFQEVKEPYLMSFETLLDCLVILNHVLPEIRVRKTILEEEKYRPVFSVEMVSEKVQRGIRFRDAYNQVAEALKTESPQRPEQVRYTHEGSIGNLCNEQIGRNFREVLASFRFREVDGALKKLLSESE